MLRSGEASTEICSFDPIFLNLKLLRSFSLINKNRFKNIFRRYVKNEFLWKEIEKMFNSGFVNISNDLIFKSRNFLDYSSLSSFLLDVYMREFDDFIQNLIIKYSVRKSFYNHKDNSSNLLYSYSNTLRKFSPIKLEENLGYSKTIKNLVSRRYNSLFNNVKVNSLSVQVYKKSINCIRYLDLVLIGFVSSKTFVTFLQRKLQGFLASRLHFGIKEVNIFNSKENSILFAGFNVKLGDFGNQSSDNKYSFCNKKYYNKVISRIIRNQKKTDKISLERFRSEFFININSLTNVDKPSNLSFYRKKVWYFIFQLEAVRSTRLNRLIFTDDMQSLVSSGIQSVIRESKVNNYHKYSFDVYNAQIKILMKDILKSSFPIKESSIVPMDLLLSKYLFEFKKKIVLLYNFYDPNAYSFSAKLLKNKSNKFSFFDSDLTEIKDVLFLTKNCINKNYFDYNKKITLLIPSNYLLIKMRSLGFLHPRKNRPIGNAKLLFFEDSFIIRSFGYIAYSIIYWYRFCHNSNTSKFFIELLRESCFLTLCRKHNKSKNWAYITYTPDLVLMRGLFNTKSFFPTRKFVSNLGRRKTFPQNFYFDEKFFLET